MPLLFIFGGMLALFGLIVTLGALPNVKRRRRIIDTPTSTIRAAPGNGAVEIKGQIVPGEQGVFRTPFTGQAAVWSRVRVEEYRSSGKSGHYVTVINEVVETQFYVDDGSGERARIMPAHAEVILDDRVVAKTGSFNAAPPQLEVFLQQRGRSSHGWVFNKSMRYHEQVLAPGEPIYALGPSSRQHGGLTLWCAGKGEGELILTNKSEEQLVGKLLTPLIVGLVMSGFGVVGVVLGLITL